MHCPCSQEKTTKERIGHSCSECYRSTRSGFQISHTVSAGCTSAQRYCAVVVGGQVAACFVGVFLISSLFCIDSFEC